VKNFAGRRLGARNCGWSVGGLRHSPGYLFSSTSRTLLIKSMVGPKSISELYSGFSFQMLKDMSGNSSLFSEVRKPLVLAFLFTFKHAQLWGKACIDPLYTTPGNKYWPTTIARSSHFQPRRTHWIQTGLTPESNQPPFLVNLFYDQITLRCCGTKLRNSLLLKP
jgi:hypothetical protein